MDCSLEQLGIGMESRALLKLTKAFFHKGKNKDGKANLPNNKASAVAISRDYLIQICLDMEGLCDRSSQSTDD